MPLVVPSHSSSKESTNAGSSSGVATQDRPQSLQTARDITSKIPAAVLAGDNDDGYETSDISTEENN